MVMHGDGGGGLEVVVMIRQLGVSSPLLFIAVARAAGFLAV